MRAWLRGLRPRRPAACAIGSITLVASLVGCQSDGPGGGISRSATPAEADTASMARSRAHLETVATVEGSPTGLAERADDEAQYVITREGRLLRIGPRSTDVLVDLGPKVTADGEGGAFDVAFTTDGGQLLVSYADRTTHDLVVLRLDLRRDGRSSGVPDEIARVGEGGEIHNAGKLLVLSDGDLLLGVGDGGELNDVAGRSRRKGSERGRILRYAGLGRSDAPATKPTSAAIGLRNPWRFFQDPVTESVWIGDVGQARWEEVDRLELDADASTAPDFGWDLTEGYQRARGLPPADVRYPVMVSGHDAQHCAIIGGPIVRDRTLPGLVGTLVLGDFCSSAVRFVRMDGSGSPVEQRQIALPDGVMAQSFATGLDNEVFVLRTDGGISRVDPGGATLERAPADLSTQPLPTYEGPRAICGVTAAIAAYPAMQGKPVDEVRQLAADQRAALAAYRDADLPEEARTPFTQLDGGLTQYLDGLEQAGWDTSAPELAFGDRLLADGTAAFQTLTSIEDDTCS